MLHQESAIRDRVVMWTCPICGNDGEDKPEFDCIGPIANPHDLAQHLRVVYVRLP